MTNILLCVSSQLICWKSDCPRQVSLLVNQMYRWPTAISKTSSELRDIGNSPMLFFGELTVILTAAGSVILNPVHLNHNRHQKPVQEHLRPKAAPGSREEFPWSLRMTHHRSKDESSWKMGAAEMCQQPAVTKRCNKRGGSVCFSCTQVLAPISALHWICIGVSTAGLWGNWETAWEIGWWRWPSAPRIQAQSSPGWEGPQKVQLFVGRGGSVGEIAWNPVQLHLGNLQQGGLCHTPGRLFQQMLAPTVRIAFLC